MAAAEAAIETGAERAGIPKTLFPTEESGTPYRQLGNY
jgi:hypothetical protein